MNTILVNNRLTLEERETVLVYSSVDKTWHMDTTVSKHANKAKKQGWKQTVAYVYDDGSLCGGAFEGAERAITIRNPNKKRVMSEKQMKNLHRHDNENEEDEDEED